MDQLRLKDLRIVKQLQFAKSIRELSRQVKMDPQNLTKRIAYIEDILGYKILDRATTGVILNEKGRRAVEASGKLLESFESLITEKEAGHRIRLCSRGYLVDFFIENCLSSYLSDFDDELFDFMDSSPELTERYARRGLVDFTLSFKDILLGENWTNFLIGEVEWKYYVRKKHPLLKMKSISNLKDYGLTSFCYIEADKLTSMSSPQQKALLADRHCGAETSRYSSQIALQSDAVAYLPNISVQSLVEQNQLFELSVNSKFREKKGLWCHVNVDRVKNKQAKFIVKSLKEALKTLK